MEDTKKWYESKAVWGGLVALGAGIAGMFGVVIGADIQADLADWVVSLASLVGGAAAIYGRVRASSQIGS